ncbi:homeobox-leucine zipper protein HAT22-like [Heracleum sosnowskyi]|uniref:Homeobox-leucine zipper protein HAT22-like n=1 Tax=Heracleum sosnowskyi TaxID=360622 RepID=A0AAD8NF38_9APIA|nr:homeobox-leucine zipper protein HAT22-like [Heracleum sosnowskyi]
MAFDDLSNTGLSLGLFSQLEQPKKQQYFQLHHHTKKAIFSPDQLTNLSLALCSDQVTSKNGLSFFARKVHGEFESGTVLNRQASSISVVSSISSSVKRDRDASNYEDVKITIVNQMKPNISGMSHSEETGSGEGVMKIKSVYNSKATSHDDREIEEEEGGARKKLRLTKQQSLILEDNFKEHITLNPKQKQALAKQLNLRARQVEVWFQNRRARTKLKQTEVDCELLKKFCKTLTDENRKLQKEVQELKALKRAAPPFYKQLPAVTLSICPSCERAGEPALRQQTSSKFCK